MTTETTDDIQAPEIAVRAEQLDVSVHDGTFTLVSPKTGEHRTFRIHTTRGGNLKGKRILSLLTGPGNEADFHGFSFVGEDGRVAVWSRYKAKPGDPPSIYERYADMFARPGYWAARGVEYKISLRCRRCGRKLTRPDSLDRGVGPECAKMI